MATKEEFLAAIKDNDNGIAHEVRPHLKAVANETDTIYGAVTGTTLMSVAINYPFPKEVQALMGGISTTLTTIAPDEEE